MKQKIKIDDFIRTVIMKDALIKNVVIDSESERLLKKKAEETGYSEQEIMYRILHFWLRCIDSSKLKTL